MIPQARDGTLAHTQKCTTSVTGFPVSSSSSLARIHDRTPHASILPSVSWAGVDSCEPIVLLSAACPFPVLGHSLSLLLELTGPSTSLPSSSLSLSPPPHHHRVYLPAPLCSHLPFFAILGCFACLLVCTCTRRRDYSYVFRYVLLLQRHYLLPFLASPCTAPSLSSTPLNHQSARRCALVDQVASAMSSGDRRGWLHNHQHQRRRQHQHQ
jgi:hypothetical protein